MILKSISSYEASEVLKNSSTYLEQLRGKKMFISGGTGFFGKWLTQILIRANSELDLKLSLTILSRNPEKARFEQSWLNDRCIEIIHGDVRDFQIANAQFDFFIHAATDARASINNTTPDIMADTIIDGTRRLLSIAKQSKKPRFLFISSGAVYGPQDPNVFKLTEDSLCGPDVRRVSSAYAEAKRVAELYCQFAKERDEIHLTVARCFAFAGPYLPLDEHFAIGNFFKNFINGEDIFISGDGSPYRSYMYPTDLIEWLLAILTSSQNGAVYNVGSDEEIQLRDLAHIIQSKQVKFNLPSTDLGVKISQTASGGSARNAYVPSIEKAKNNLGLRIRKNLDSTIDQTLSWLLDAK